MSVVRQPVRERGPVVEHEVRRTVATLDAGAEGAVVTPVVEDFGFEFWKTRCTARRLGIGAHRVVSCAQVRSGTGTTTRRLRECRGTTPLAHRGVRRSTTGDDGPDRSVLVGRADAAAVLPKAPR